MYGLQGKVVIVTGASSGIGLATAQTLNRYGAKLLACDITEAPESVLSLQDCKFVRANLADTGAAGMVVEEAVAAFGRIDGLLNIAGVTDTNNSVDTLTDELWDRCIAINLTAPVKLMRSVIHHMLRAGGGSIVNVASKAGISGGTAGVTAADTDLQIGATKNVAYRFRGNPIRCNAICPGGVKTNIHQSIDETKYDMAAMEVMKPVHDLAMVGNGIGFAEPQSQGNVLAFLISDLSSEVNGAVIPVDHGWSTL